MALRKDKLWTAIFITALVTANVLSAKLWIIGPFMIPGGVLCYGITFLCTDIIGEMQGKESAEETIKLGLVAQIISTILIRIGIWIPGTNQAFDEIMGTNFLFTIAGIIAYMVSQCFDVQLFHRLKDIYPKSKWLWNNVATITSQLIDTIIYIGIAFGLQGYDVTTLLWMVVGQAIIKTAVAILDTPFFYYFTREGKKW